MSANDPFEGEMLEMIADVLALEPGEVQPDMTWKETLDGESIELLELSFRCEKRFGVRVQFQQMLDQKTLQTDDKGVLTPEALMLLKSRYPFLDLTEFSKDPRIGRITEILTVRTIIEFVRQCVSNAQTLPGAAKPSTAG